MTTMTDPTPQSSLAGQDDDVLLEVNNPEDVLPRDLGYAVPKTVAYVKAVDDVSFTVKRGETLGLVGESGAERPRPGRCILQLYKPTDGGLYLRAGPHQAGTKQMRAMRREMQVFSRTPTAP